MSTPDANLEGNMPEGELNVEQLVGSLFPKGDSGEIIILETITTNPGTNAEVENVGTRTKAKLKFYIPRGNTGATGNGIQSITKVGTSGLVDTYRITMTDGTYYDFTVTNADVGSAYTKSETNQLLDAKVDKTSVTDDYSSTKTEADKLKIASLWAIKTMKAAIDSTTGILTNLTTTDKANLVAAINELVTGLGGKVGTSTYTTKMNSLDSSITSLTNTKQNAAYYEASVNGADFTINSTIPVAAGVEYKVHFAATNNTNNARLSVDNGTTFYNVDGCKAVALGGEYLRMMFDGTKFVYMTDMGPSIIEYVAEVNNNE